MKSTLTTAHLLRHFLLFVLTVLFLLTMMRAAYALWQFPLLEETGAFVNFFVQGLRFDLALIGIICFIPVVLGSLLSMIGFTRSLAKLLITLFLFGGLILILALELITPWFIVTQGVRPDPSILAEIGDPIAMVQRVFAEYMIPAVIAGVLVLLILIAFWSRLELRRFLRYRTSILAGITTTLIGGALCIFAIWSTPDFRTPALGPVDANISENATINDLVMNTTYKALHSVALPYIPIKRVEK